MASLSNEDSGGDKTCRTSSTEAPRSLKSDGSLVRTLALLTDSPNVFQPSKVNAPVPTPSIYLDGRGEIHNIQAGNKRINILFTKKGVMRSGDIHKNIQHDFVFEGSVEVWFLEKNGSTTKLIYGAYEYIQVPPLTPHVFHFLEDTVMAEWWEPEPFEAWFYTPYRDIVQESFTGTETGKLVELVRKDESYSTRKFSLLLSASTIVGVVVGIMIGRRRK
jgi:hypothetical protein